MRESVRIFFACALGAFIGGLLGLELKSVSDWLWLPSALLGGAIGWVMYAPRALGAAIARAWREVINWRPDKRYWKVLVKNTANEIPQRLTGFAYYGLFAGLWAASYYGADTLWYAHPALRTTLYELCWTIASLSFMLIPTFFGIALLFEGEKGVAFAPFFKRPRFVRRFCLLCNPVVLPFAIIGGIIKLIVALWNDIYFWQDLKALGRFAKRAFVLAHSDLRLLCLVDATIGAIAGYFLGSALLGALVGGASGLLNYWVVSVKLLHLTPAHARNE